MLCMLMFLVLAFQGVEVVTGSRPGDGHTAPRRAAIDDLINDLSQRIAQSQIQADVPYIPLVQFGKTKGAYPSEVKINFHGQLDLAEIRRRLNIPDNNMFVTAWVTSQILEASRYPNVPSPHDEQLAMALTFIGDNHDRNHNGSGLMAFWKETYNSTTKYYESMPSNLVGLIKSSFDLPVDTILKLLEKLGLKILPEELEQLLEMRATFLDAFRIPPDFDDTFVNIGLGSLLNKLKEKFPGAQKIWQDYNSNITAVFKSLKAYAYRPFSNNKDVNTIDPRTYYWLRKFLDEAKTGNKSLALVSTWAQNLSLLRSEFIKGVAMPYNVNNVDATVAANFVYGMTSSILSGVFSADVLSDKDVEQIYLNTTSMVAFAVSSNMSDRADLALTYYPSRLEFYWFVSRTFSELLTSRNKKPLPCPQLETVYQILGSVRGYMSVTILSYAQREVDDQFYFDDFLGNADLDLQNKTENRGEDRIFTTAMAVNALLYSWTAFNESTGRAEWLAGVSDDVKTVINGSVSWLTANTLSAQLEPWNAFFSGSTKSEGTEPFWYPSNRFEYVNGSKISYSSDIPDTVDFLLGMEGYVAPQKYEAMVNATHFGVPTPRGFSGYNAPGDFFPFWSSSTYTYSSVLLALARFSSILV